MAVSAPPLSLGNGERMTPRSERFLLGYAAVITDGQSGGDADGLNLPIFPTHID